MKYLCMYCGAEKECATGLCTNCFRFPVNKEQLEISINNFRQQNAIELLKLNIVDFELIDNNFKRIIDDSDVDQVTKDHFKLFFHLLSKSQDFANLAHIELKNLNK